MLEIRCYVASSGEEPFAEWFAELDGTAAAKIVRALVRMEQGISPTSKALEKVFWNIGSILAPVTGFISAEMAIRLSSC